jgi:hypothetical protein
VGALHRSYSAPSTGGMPATNAYIRPSELHQPSHQADKCRAHKSYGPFQRIEAEKSTLGRRKCESRHRHRPLFGTIKFSSRVIGG